MKKTIFSLLLSFLFLGSYAQIPTNYYDAANGKTGYELKSALHTIITNGHSDQGYSELYSAYEIGDTDPSDDFVWDMYSENPGGDDPYNYTHYQKQCGNYQNEGDCYNREHLFPQGTFDKQYPMRSDYHHVVPSDGKINGMRGNYAFGEVPNATPENTSQNGSKVGACDANLGYGGTVFEPLDEYKGDIARSMLYFATRYETQVDSWTHTMLNGTENQVYTDWFIALLIKWHNQDPVSTKEEVRNTTGYNFQGNANPFISHPEWVECIWNANCSGLNFTSSPIKTAVQDDTYTYNITFSEATITLESTSSWLSLTSITTTSATLTGIPTSGDVGTENVSLKIVEGGNETFQNFDIEVTDGNSLAFTSTAVKVAKEGVQYTYNVTAIGNDGANLTLTGATLPGWLSFSKSTSINKTLTGMPTSGDVGPATVLLELSDGTKTVSQSFIISVSDASAVSEVIITQYYEGSTSNSKYIEITNIGGAAIDLSSYFLGTWSNTENPSASPKYELALTGTIAAGETKVYKNPDSSEPSYAFASAIGTTVCYFNGGDPIAIMKGGNAWEDRVDCLYSTGAWGTDNGFYRKASIVIGNIDMSVLNGSGEWIEITEDAAKNATSQMTEYIGYHETETNGIEDLNVQFKLYPNPANDILVIDALMQINKVEILSITGQIVKQVSANNTKVEMNVSDLEKGIYFLNLTDSQGNVSSKKFVKQ